MNKRTARLWLGVAATLVWVACVLPTTHAAGTAMLPGKLEHALDLEKEGHWLSACVLYERILKEDRSATEGREGYQRCLRHLQQVRRHRDASFRQLVLNRKPSQALNIYEEVLAKLQANYIDRDKVTLTYLFQRGLEELRFALEDDVFVHEYLADVTADAIRAFRTRLEKWRDREVTSRAEAREQVLAVAADAQDSPLHLNPIVVILEFACGACNSLDEYTSYLTPAQYSDVQAGLKGQFVGIGIDLAVVEQQLVITRVYANSPAAMGLKPGDRILAVDRKPVSDLSPEVAIDRLRGEAGTVVELEVASPGDMAPRGMKFIRQAVTMPSVVDLKLEDGIGYFRLIAFQETTVQEMKDAILQLQTSGMKVLVLDLRGNTGGVLKVGAQVAELFLGEGVLARTKSRIKELNVVYQAHNPAPLTFPLVVLIDGDTASSAELVAGALKDHKRATLVGQTTFGKGLQLKVLRLDAIPAGIRITVASFYSPDNHPYTGQGVMPHITVAPEPGSADAAKSAAWQSAQQLAMMLR